MSTLQTGKVLAPGEGELMVAAHVLVAENGGPKPEIRYTRGLPHDFEIGGAVALDRSVTLQGRHQLLGSKGSRFAASLGLRATALDVQDVEKDAVTCGRDSLGEYTDCPQPEGPFYARDEELSVDLAVPLIMSFHLDEGSAFYLSTQHLTRVGLDSSKINEHFLGVGLGMELKRTSGVRLEVARITSLSDTERGGAQASVGVFF